MKLKKVKTAKAAMGNRKLADFEELRDIVISHRMKTRNLCMLFNSPVASPQQDYLDEIG